MRGGLVIDSTIDSNYAYGRGGGLATFGDLARPQQHDFRQRRRAAFGGGGCSSAFRPCSTRATARSRTIAATTAAAFSSTSSNASLLEHDRRRQHRRSARRRRYRRHAQRSTIAGVEQSDRRDLVATRSRCRPTRCAAIPACCRSRTTAARRARTRCAATAPASTPATTRRSFVRPARRRLSARHRRGRGHRCVRVRCARGRRHGAHSGADTVAMERRASVRVPCRTRHARGTQTSSERRTESMRRLRCKRTRF